MHPAAHVQLRLDRLIDGRYYTPEQQRRATAGQAFHCTTGHANFQYLRFALNISQLSRCPGCAQGKMLILPL
jgi:hypothetical protein